MAARSTMLSCLALGGHAKLHRARGWKPKFFPWSMTQRPYAATVMRGRLVVRDNPGVTPPDKALGRELREGSFMADPAHVLVGLFAGLQPTPFGAFLTQRDRRHGPAEPDGEDLEDLGVSIVGHRRKLLHAIAALRADTEPKTAPV